MSSWFVARTTASYPHLADRLDGLPSKVVKIGGSEPVERVRATHIDIKDTRVALLDEVKTHFTNGCADRKQVVEKL